MADDTPSEGPLTQPGPSPDTNAPPAASSTLSGCLVGCGFVLMVAAVMSLVLGLEWAASPWFNGGQEQFYGFALGAAVAGLAFFWVARRRRRQ